MLDEGHIGGAPDGTPHDADTLATAIESLAALPNAELRRSWSDAWGAPPPKGARRRFLMLGVALRWQVFLHGGFPKPVERRLARLEAAYRKTGDLAEGVLVQQPRATPGARFIRVWRGERHEVHVVEGGYLWRGQTWRSLSAIAGEITGANRNGPAFFGLRKGDRQG